MSAALAISSFAAHPASEVTAVRPRDMLSLSVSSLTSLPSQVLRAAGVFLGGPLFRFLVPIAVAPSSFVAEQKETTDRDREIVKVQTENVNEHG